MEHVEKTKSSRDISNKILWGRPGVFPARALLFWEGAIGGAGLVAL